MRRTLPVIVLLVALASWTVREWTLPREAPPADTLQYVRERPRVEYVRTVDGDTLVVKVNGKEERLRLLFINTVERGEPGYKEASDALRGLVEGKTLSLEHEEGEPERDRYGRLLVYVYADGLNTNVEMVRLGWTRYWTKYGRSSKEAEFLKAEAEGRKRGRYTVREAGSNGHK